MNKKVLTLCASFLLAGGLTSSALASVFKEVTDTQIKEGQYFYVFTKPGGPLRLELFLVVQLMVF